MKPKQIFIDELVQETRPTRRLTRTEMFWARWVILATVIVTSIMLTIKSFRPGFFSQLRHVQFTIETSLWFLALLLPSYLALLLMIPGRAPKATKLWLLGVLPATAGLLFWGVGLFGYSSLPASGIGKRDHCSLEILILAWIPYVGLLWRLRKGYIQKGPWTIVLASLSAASLPTALMQVACMYAPKHNLIYHGLPFIFMVIGGAWLGLFWMRKTGSIQR